jgi:hypothetical protein
MHDLAYLSKKSFQGNLILLKKLLSSTPDLNNTYNEIITAIKKLQKSLNDSSQICLQGKFHKKNFLASYYHLCLAAQALRKLETLLTVDVIIKIQEKSDRQLPASILQCVSDKVIYEYLTNTSQPSQANISLTNMNEKLQTLIGCFTEDQARTELQSRLEQMKITTEFTEKNKGLILIFFTVVNYATPPSSPTASARTSPAPR